MIASTVRGLSCGLSCIVHMYCSHPPSSHLSSSALPSLRDTEHLALVAVPLLTDLLHAIQRRNAVNSSTDSVSTDSTNSADSTDSDSTDSADLSSDVRLSVFSGHDVTLLPLLYALRASVIVDHVYDKGSKVGLDTDRRTDEESPHPKNESYWPAYGTYTRTYAYPCFFSSCVIPVNFLYARTCYLDTRSHTIAHTHALGRYPVMILLVSSHQSPYLFYFP